MTNRPHSFSGDQLLLRIIETEVDACDENLTAERRHACVQQVSELLGPEIMEHLLKGDLSPETLTRRIREVVEKTIASGASPRGSEKADGNERTFEPGATAA